MKGPDDRQEMEAVWRSRADRLSKRPAFDKDEQGTLQVIVVRLGKELYGIDLPDVAEVLPPVRATPVPGAASVFAGAINVHGEIRPVIDLGRLLGIETIGNTDPRRVILLRKEGRELGLQIDSVEQIRQIERQDDSKTTGENICPTISDYISSKFIRSSTNDLLMLLSTEALFAELDT
jgi:purine-binding chemotaxis protein CheW